MIKEKEKENKLQTRPPVVVILGHVDHGKCVAPSSLIPLANGEILSAQKIWEKYKAKGKTKKYKDEGYITKIENGPKVFSFNKRKIEQKKISHLWKLKAPKQMIKIKLRSGDTIEVTPEHPFYVLDNQGNIKQKTAHLIKEKDFIVIPQTLPVFQNKINETKKLIVKKLAKIDNLVVFVNEKNEKAKKFLTKLKKENKQGLYRKGIFSTNPGQVLKHKKFRAKDFIKLINYFKFTPLEGYQMIASLKNASEKQRAGKTSEKITLPKSINDFYKLGYISGCLAGDGELTGVILHNQDKEIISVYCQYLKDVFGLKTKIIKNDSCFMVQTNGRITLRRFLIDIMDFPKSNKSLNINIPLLILSLKPALKGFIEGVFDTDGYISDVNRNYIAEITSKSKGLIKSLSIALLNFGIHSTIFQKRKYHYLKIGSIPYLKRFHKSFSLRHKGKRKKLKKIHQKTSTSRIFDLTPLSGNLLKSFYLNENLFPYFSKYRCNKYLSRLFIQRLIKFKNKVNLPNPFLSPDIKHLINPGEISCTQVKQKKILKSRYKFVYDFTIPENHNFIAERIIVHNSSILEAIKDLKITEKESGGITQHIGAYQVEHQNKKITFIDTPGHEVFSAMRSRGAKVADIAILVIAAEEGVKPQTKEAITHIKKIGLPLIVALNKIDKKEAQPEKVKRELSENDILVESLGGKIPCINLSAKNGQGIDQFLEMILLVAEMEELKDEPDEIASGLVIESYQDNRRGATATLLVKKGILKNKDIIGTDSAMGKIKTMEDFQFQHIEKAPASMPVIITGFNKVPQVGEKFSVFKNFDEAQIRIDKKTAKRNMLPGGEKEVFVFDPDKKVLNIILKADVHGSLEAIKESLKSIPSDEVIIRILKSEVGEINESNIKLAESAKAKVIGFRIKINSSVKQLAQQKKIRVSIFEIIYELIQEIRQLASNLLDPEITRNDLGKAKILAVFRTEKDRQIIGGKVTSGQIKKGTLIDVIRNGEKAGQGKLMRLQRDKKEADEVNKGQECGLLFQGTISIEKGDILEFYEEERKKREI